MTPHRSGDDVLLYAGDCRKVLAGMEPAAVDAVVTDPPYDLTSTGSGGFMGKAWDGTGVAFSPDTWRAVLRTLKPGGHLIAFGAPRTYHRLACAIEDAGFEIRDSLHWLYGSGYPHSLDVSKAIDKAAGAERKVISEGTPLKRMIPGADQNRTGSWTKDSRREFVPRVTVPATAEAARWEGWGTALKPSHEPIVLARKPLEGSTPDNVLGHGTGALNIDGCRVAVSDPDYARNASGDRGHDGNRKREADFKMTAGRASDIGRWPPNVLLSEDAADELGRAARVFPVFRYEAKADSSERPKLADGTMHPTVKPVSLMRWLVRLVTPPGGLVLDPFAGSGTTGEACAVEGLRCILVEQQAEYVELIKKRMSRPIQPDLFGGAA